MDKDLRELEEITFGIFSEKEIRDVSVCQVNNPKLCSTDKNTGYGTVYDPRMGTLENNRECESCGQDIWGCAGHFGFIELNEPIVHPLFYKRVVDFLKCFCIKCNKPLITEDQLAISDLIKLKSTKRFDRILERIEKIDMCSGCSHPQPDIKYSSLDNNISMVYKQKDKGKISIVLPVDEIKKTFENITDDNIRLLGFNPELVHPRNLILTVFPVLPPTCRPYVIADGQLCDDDLTIQIVEIIKANNHLKSEDETHISETKKQKYLQTLKFRISTFYNNSSNRAKHTTNGRPIKGLKERLTSKEGLIRNNLMGKRCIFMGTKIILWNGEIKNVEDIKIGDVLIGNDGEKRNVLKLFNGTDQMYKINQENGCEYIVNSEHILTFKYIHNEKPYWTESINSWIYTWFDKGTMAKKSKKISAKKQTKDEAYLQMKKFIDCLDKNNTINICIQDYLKLSDKTKKFLYGYKIENPVNWEYKEVEIDPYILGMWLGDGTKNGKSFTSIDPELIEYWNIWASKNNMDINMYLDGQNMHYGISKKVKNCNKPTVFKEKLSKYGLINNKFIPKDYIINSKEVRLAVLAGLIDTDGSVEQGGSTIRISQSFDHKDIIDGAKFIADSLGFQTSVKNKKTSWKYKEEHKYGNALVLTISGYGLENIPTILSRKKCRAPLISGNNMCKILVEPYKVGEFYGFEIDGNNLFVLPDFTVLHNCEQTGRTVIGPDPTLKMGQLGVPQEIANTLTYPVRVTNFNYNYLTELVNSGKVNHVITKNNVKINMQYHIFDKGTRLNHGDIITRIDQTTGKPIEITVNNGKELLKLGDKITRNGELLTDLKYPSQKKYHLNIGDICERQLKDGDILLLNRQPTLHSGSMMAQEVVIHSGKTLRFNLSIAKSFNADFDGDEIEY
jgi:hypothetical protein